ncbi:MAG: tetratricopeptide repeat protein [Bacteroidales bacterium]
MKQIAPVLLFLFLLQVSFGKSSIDSLQAVLEKTSEDTSRVKTLIALWEATAYSDMESAWKAAYDAKQLSEKLNYPRGLAESCHRIGILHYNHGVWDSAIIYYSRSLEFSRVLNDISMEGNVLNAIGIIYYSQGIYGKALTYVEESLKKLSEVNDEEGIAMGLSLLGNINFYSGNYEKL